MNALVAAAGNLVFQLVMNSVRELYLPHASAFAALVSDRAGLAGLYARVAETVRARDAAGAVAAVDELATVQGRSFLR
jgi:DNA-binding FadR family transcriptional regulator